MSLIDDLIARGQERAKLTEAQRRWDSASLFNALSGSGGRGDKGAASRPTRFVQPLDWPELESLWENNGIARRIVEIPPRYATRKGWDIEGIPNQIEQELGLQSVLREGQIWARVYGGCVGMLVTEDDVPPAFQAQPERWFAQPLDMERIGKLHCIQIFDPYEARPQIWDQSIISRNFRMPELWSVNADGFYATVHHTRILHFRGAVRPPSWRRHGLRSFHNYPDVSILQSIWDDIRRYVDVLQGGATISQELRQHVLKMGMMKGQLGATQKTELQEFLQIFVRSLGTLGLAVVGPDDEYHQAQTPPSGFMELTDTMREALSAVTGFPQSILFGDTPSGLNTDGESSWQGFRQVIDDVQQHKIKPKLERVAQIVFAQQDVPQGLEPPEDGTIAIRFAPLSEPSDAEEAALRQTIADTDGINIGNGIYTAAAVARHRFSPEGFKSEPPQLTEGELADIEFEDAQRQAMSVMPGGGLGGDPMLGEDNGSGAQALPAAPGAPPVPSGGQPGAGPPPAPARPPR